MNDTTILLVKLSVSMVFENNENKSSSGESSSSGETPLENSPALEEPQPRQIPNLVTIPAFVSVPAKLNITYNIVGNRPQALTFNGPTIQEINFRAEVDLEPVFLQVQEIKERLNILANYVMNTPSELARHIGNELVGETYLRWDSRVQFYPTITFIFLEPEEVFQDRRKKDYTAKQRKVQVKLRIVDYEVGAMTEVIADELESKYRSLIRMVRGLSFYTGDVRCTYVNPGKVKWKTTVFARHVSDAQRLLGILCAYVGEKYQPYCISYTSKHQGPPQGLPPGVIDQETPPAATRVSLWKVSLLINKKGKQIVLYHVKKDY